MWTVRLILHLFAVTLLSSSIVLCSQQALPDNPCTYGWRGPHTRNFINCTKPSDWIDWGIGKLPQVITPLILGCAVVVVFPLILFMRFYCQCCGGSRERPGHYCGGGNHWDSKPEEERLAAYSIVDVRISKYCTLLLLVFSIAFVVQMFNGANKFSQGLEDFDAAFVRSISFAREVVEKVKQGVMRSYYPYPINMNGFNIFASQMDDLERGYDESTDAIEAIRSFAFGFAYLALGPAILLAFACVLAFFNVRDLVAPITILVYCILTVMYGAAATFFFFLNLPVKLACTELDAQTQRVPGLLQWSVIPRCEYEMSFNMQGIFIPFLDCNALLDKAITFCQPFCNSFPAGLESLGVGCLVAQLGLITGAILLLRGQKRFFDPAVIMEKPLEMQTLSTSPSDLPEEAEDTEKGSAPPPAVPSPEKGLIQ